MKLAMRGLEAKTSDPYPAGWRLRVVPSSLDRRKARWPGISPRQWAFSHRRDDRI
ncbi:hypothetical protein [Streptomyces sp. NPDC005336]|uniref:hypothetical protein n=1 Tax=Streptomyces sp. NPDC005336 TaxID=3157035 RepID=UPI0033B24DDD